MQLELFEKKNKPKSYFWENTEPEEGKLYSIDDAIAYSPTMGMNRYCYMDFCMILEKYPDGKYLVLVVNPFSERFMEEFLLESKESISPKMYYMFQWRLVENGYPFMRDERCEKEK